MRTRTKQFSRYIFFLLGLLIAACGSQQQAEKEVPEEVAEPVKDVVKDNAVDEFTFIMPSPLQIASIFKKSGLTYVSGIANSPDNVSKYSSKLRKSLAYGAYATDLSYAVLNNQSEEALKYMKCVKQLSDELGMATIFNSESLFESFENNLGNEDSMIYILASIQEHFDEYLDEHDQNHEAAIFFTGGWVEGMYIGTKVINPENRKKLVPKLVEQMTILENLLKGLAHSENQMEGIEGIKTDLAGIKDIYENLESIKSQPDKDEISFKDITISDAELNAMTGKIAALRTKIING